jgi:hypothetical protein
MENLTLTELPILRAHTTLPTHAQVLINGMRKEATAKTSSKISSKSGKYTQFAETFA